MARSTARLSREIEHEWPDLDLPNRCLVHIAKRSRAGILVSEPSHFGRRLAGSRRRP